MKHYDIIVLGAGPAGISSAIYAKRAGRSVVVLDGGKSKLLITPKISNFYGAPDISGKELYLSGINQAKELGVKITKQTANYIEKNYEKNLFIVKTEKEEYSGRAVILATGGANALSDERLDKYKGKNISSCAICDGFFYKNKVVGVLGESDYALSEAEVLAQVAKKVYIFSEGKTKLKDNGNISIIDTPIKSFRGKELLEGVLLEDGELVKVSGLFLAKGTMTALDIAKKLGITTKDNHIVINNKSETSLSGVFAAGDITGGLYQVSKAVYEGTIAGLNAAAFANN